MMVDCRTFLLLGSKVCNQHSDQRGAGRHQKKKALSHWEKERTGGAEI